MEGRSVFDKLFDDRIKTLFVATTADLCECQAGIRLEIFVVPGAFDLDDYGAAVKRILDDDIRSAVAEFHIGSDSSVAHRQHADQKSVVVLFSLVKITDGCVESLNLLALCRRNLFRLHELGHRVKKLRDLGECQINCVNSCPFEKGRGA